MRPNLPTRRLPRRSDARSRGSRLFPWRGWAFRYAKAASRSRALLIPGIKAKLCRNWCGMWAESKPSGIRSESRKYLSQSISDSTACQTVLNNSPKENLIMQTTQFPTNARPIESARRLRSTNRMKAAVFHGKNDIRVEEVPRPHPGAGEAVIRITLTTICGTDLHIVRGEYPVRPGLIIGHEPVGVIAELGLGLTGYKVGERVLVGAVTPCGQCNACLSGHLSQCGHGQGYQAIGGWRFGNTIHGAQAEFLLVPHAQANLAKIPDELSDQQVVLLADIASTGFSGAESANVRIGDSVVVFAQGPIGLCATAGAKLSGGALVIGIDGDSNRLDMAKQM